MHSTSQTIMRRPRRFPAPGLLALALLPALLPAPCARAAIVEWSGSLGLDWTDRGNWANGAGPAAADDAYIRNSGTALINAVDAGTVNRLEVGGQGKDMYGTLDILNGGTLAVFTYAMIGYNGNVQGAAGLGVVTVSGPGSVLMTTGTVNNAIYVGRGSVGVLNILNGGHVKSTGELAIGESNSGLSLGPGLANGSGTITVSGPGSLLEAADANIAKNRAGSLIILDGAEARFSGNVSIGCNQRDPGVVSGEVCVGAGSLIAVTANNKNFTVGGAGNSGGDLGGRSGLLAGTGTVQMFASNINIGITRNGTISAGDRPGEIGTLSIIGGLNLGDIGDAGREKSASMKVDHNAAAADLIRATGAVIFGDILNVDLSSLASVTGIPIVTAGGNITDALPGTLRFTINGAAFSTLDRLAGALPAASLSISGSQLLMTINSTAANKHLVWTGAADNAWNLTGANWREDGGGAIAFLTGDAVTFATLGGVATATVTAGVGQIVSQLALAGDTSYTLAADLTADGSQARALATGTSGKLLLGAAGAPFNATLTLAGNNSFLGGVTLATGTLSVATVRNLGASLSNVAFAAAGPDAAALLITDDITFDSRWLAGSEPAGADRLAVAAGVNATVQMACGKTLSFAQNPGVTWGQPILNEGNLAILTDAGAVTFTGLRAGDAGGDGGAILNRGGTLALTDALFTSNTAARAGGAISNSGVLTLRVTGTAAYTGNAALDDTAAPVAAAGGFLHMAAGAAATLDIAGSLAIGDAASLAAQTDSIASAGTAALITKTGAGTLVLNGNNTAYLGTLDIAAGAVQINSAAALPGGAINGAGTLILNNAGGNPALAAGDFHGTLRLAGTPAGAGTACDLDALAPASPARAILAASRLQLAAGGALALAAGAHALGGLDFAGGDFHTRRDGFGFSGTLGVSGTLALTDPVTSKIIFDDFNPGDSMGSLYGGAGGGVFSLDEAGANAVLLIAAGALAPGHEGRTVKLYAGDGATLIATSQTLALDASAVGTFENMAIAITGSAGAGLYMDSLLQQIEILPGKTYTLAADPATDNTLLNTTITGAGRLAIDAAGAAVTLGAANTHTGETRVTTGTLRLAAAGALGDTAGLVIDAGAAVQLDGDAIYGNLQSIGAYTGAPGARLALGTGTLAVTAAKGPGLFTDNGAATDLGAAGRLILNGGLISGPLTAAAAGAARLDLAAGTTTITSANPSLAITTAVAAGATLRLADGRALGAGAIAFDGTLELAASSTATAAGLLLNPLSGSGAITKTGAGAMGIASANPDLAVPVSVLEGTLVLASLEALGSGSTAGAITLAEGAAVEFSGVAGAIANPVAGDGTLAFAGSANVEIARPIPVPRALIRDGAVVTLTGAGALGGAAGRITIEDNGALAIDLYDHTLATVTLNRNGRIRLTPAGTAFRKLTINRLEGSGGILEVNIDFKRVRDYSVVALTPVIPAGVAADHFTIAGSGGGAHGVLVNSANPAFTAPLDGSYTPLISTAAGDSSRYHLVDAAGAAIPHYESGLVALKLVKGGEDESTYTSDPGAWYLADSGLASVADAIIGTAAMAGKDWHYSIDALYLRMGDVRAAWQTPAPGAARGNVWARARAYRLKANYKLLGRSFDETLHGLTAGADYAFRPREEITLLAGAFFDGGRVTRDFVNHGGGESGTFGAGLYASLLFENGWHGDLVLKSDRSKNSFDARTVDSRLTRGRYNSTAEGFSAELGRRFQLKDDWWFESSLQLATAWLDAAAYEAQTSESPIPVRVDGSRSTQYRGGLRIGRMVDRWTPYAKIAWAKTDTAGGVIHAHTRAFDPGMNGWRFETGAGASLRLGDRAALHFDYEYATADAYQRPWSIHLGYRTQW